MPRCCLQGSVETGTGIVPAQFPRDLIGLGLLAKRVGEPNPYAFNLPFSHFLSQDGNEVIHNYLTISNTI